MGERVFTKGALQNAAMCTSASMSDPDGRALFDLLEVASIRAETRTREHVEALNRLNAAHEQAKADIEMLIKEAECERAALAEERAALAAEKAALASERANVAKLRDEEIARGKEEASAIALFSGRANRTRTA